MSCRVLPFFCINNKLLPLYIGVASDTAREEDSFTGISALKNLGRLSKNGAVGALGTAQAPIHMVTSDSGNFKDQMWRTFRSIALAFLLISGVGALIEDRGITKGMS